MIVSCKTNPLIKSKTKLKKDGSVHEAFTFAGFKDGQMYVALYSYADRLFPYFEPMISKS